MNQWLQEQERTTVWRRWALWMIAGSALLVSGFGSNALATVKAGGKDIRSAPMIGAGQRVEGHLGALNATFEFFRINFVAGDRVQVRIESAGENSPCVGVYKPGTDDFTFRQDGNLPTDFNRNGPRVLQTFIAGQTGTYVLGINSICDGNANRWAYGLLVIAPHSLRLVLPTQKTVRSGQTLRVRVLGALSRPVTDPKLRVNLFGVWGGPPRRIGQAQTRDGSASFKLKLPTSARSKQIRLIATAGDNVNWVSARAGRAYRAQ